MHRQSKFLHYCEICDVYLFSQICILLYFIYFVQICYSFYRDGLKTMEHFNAYIEKLLGQLGKIRQKQEQEKRGLIELRDSLKTSLTDDNKEVLIFNLLRDIVEKINNNNVSQAPSASVSSPYINVLSHFQMNLTLNTAFCILSCTFNKVRNY